MDEQTETPRVIKKKLTYRRVWQARLLNRKTRRGAIPIDVSLFKKVKGTVGLHGYRRVRKDDADDVRAYRKDSYGMTLMFVDVEERTIEGKTESWSALMSICSEFNLRAYRSI